MKRIEYIPLNKDVLKTLDEILVHNRKILEMNLLIIQSIVNPTLIIPIEEK